MSEREREIVRKKVSMNENESERERGDNYIYPVSETCYHFYRSDFLGEERRGQRITPVDVVLAGVRVRAHRGRHN